MPLEHFRSRIDCTNCVFEIYLKMLEVPSIVQKNDPQEQVFSKMFLQLQDGI